MKQMFEENREEIVMKNRKKVKDKEKEIEKRNRKKTEAAKSF